MRPVIMTPWFERVKLCVGWNSTDQEYLENLRSVLNSDLNRMVEVLGQRLALVKGAEPLMSNARFVQRLHGLLYEWLMGLLDARFDHEYVRERRMFGTNLRHQ